MESKPTPPAPAILQEVLAQLGIGDDHFPVFLNFFRSDCPWCTAEIPRLADVYGLHPGLRVHVIGIAEHESDASARDYVTSLGWNCHIISDPEEKISAAFGVTRVPTVVAIDTHGQIVRVYEGATEQLPGILDQTIFAVAHDTEPPEYSMVGNGCAP